jgi:hypothetical protein
MDAPEPSAELVFFQSTIGAFDLEAFGLEHFVGDRVNRFQQQDLQPSHESP